jgi:voltage-gated potassium channel
VAEVSRRRLLAVLAASCPWFSSASASGVADTAIDCAETVGAAVTSIAATTVGYGDITPKTTEGKVISVLVMLVGIGTATLVIGAVAQRFLAPSVEHVEIAEDDMLVQVREISARLGQLERALREQTRAARNP